MGKGQAGLGEEARGGSGCTFRADGTMGWTSVAVVVAVLVARVKPNAIVNSSSSTLVGPDLLVAVSLE